MGDWRNNKDDEVELDGVGGVNILVKADVHRSGIPQSCLLIKKMSDHMFLKVSISRPMHLKIKPKQRASAKWPKGQVTRWLGCLTTWSGILILRKRKVIWAQGHRTKTFEGMFMITISILPRGPPKRFVSYSPLALE